MSVKEIKQDQFDTAIKDHISIVDFYASWCGPCRMLAPVIEDVSKDFKNIDFFKVNIDDNEQLATKYKIKSIPTVVLFVKNEPINKFMGFMTRDAICQWIKKNTASLS